MMASRTLRTLLLFPVLLFTAALFGQDYRIEYDKLSGKLSYYKLKSGKEAIEPKKVTHPKLRNGDVVELRLRNLNEFVYQTRVVARFEKDTTLHTSTFGNAFGTFLGASSGFLGDLDLGGFDLGGAWDMVQGIFQAGGSAESSDTQRALSENAERTDSIRVDLQSIERDIEQLHRTRQYIQALMLSKDKPLAEIREKKKRLLDELQKQVPSALSPEYARTLQRRAQLDVSALRSVSNSNNALLASVNSVDTRIRLMRGFQQNQVQLQSIEAQLSATDLPKLVKEINDASSNIDKARFEHTEQVMIEEETARMLIMDLSIFDAIEAPTTPPIEASIAGKVITYHPGLFVDPEGAIGQESCEGCTPLKRSEGQVFNPSIAPDDEEGMMESAYGRWRFWDEKGRLIEERHMPNDRVPAELMEAASVPPSMKLDEKRIIKLPVRQGVLFGSSAGFSMSALFDEASEYTKVNSIATGDSTVILADALGSFSPVVSTFFHFHLDGPALVKIGGQVGLGVSLADKTSLHLFAGPSVIIGRKQRMAVNMGLSATQVKRLRSSLSVGVPISNDTLAAIDDIVVPEYSFGWFAGLSFMIGMKD